MTFGDSKLRATVSFSVNSYISTRQGAWGNSTSESGSMLSRRHSEAINPTKKPQQLQQLQHPSRANAPPLPPPRRSTEKLAIQRTPTADIDDDDFDPRKADTAERVGLLGDDDDDDKAPKLDHLYSVPKKREPPPLPPKLSRSNSGTLEAHNPFSPLLFDETSK